MHANTTIKIGIEILYCEVNYIKLCKMTLCCIRDGAGHQRAVVFFYLFHFFKDAA